MLSSMKAQPPLRRNTFKDFIMKKPEKAKAPMGPNLNQLLADVPQLPTFRRRQKRGEWGTHLPHVTVRWLGTHWVFTFLNPLAQRLIRLRTSNLLLLKRWLLDYFSGPQHAA
jgi:hypothetical protein